MGCGGKESTSGRNGAARRHLRRTRKKACRDWCRAVTPKPQNDDKPRPLSRHVASSVLNRNEMPVASHYRPGREWITVLFSRPRARHSLEIGRGWAHRARPCTFCGSVRGTSRKADASFTASSGKSAPKLNRSLLNNSLSF